MLSVDRVGRFTDFNAEPGYGLSCTVSHIEAMLTNIPTMPLLANQNEEQKNAGISLSLFALLCAQGKNCITIIVLQLGLFNS